MWTGFDGDNSAFVTVPCLTNRNLTIVKIEYEISSTHYRIAPDVAFVGFGWNNRESTVNVTGRI